MWTIDTGPWWGGGIATNTETQNLDLYNQLRVGVRYFDMRIVRTGSDYYVAHVDNETSPEPHGALGPSLDNLIDGMNRFSNDHPGEVVIWWMRYLTYLDKMGGHRWVQAEFDRFYDALERIENRCPGNLTDKITGLPVKNLMDANNGRGCVLLIIDGNFDNTVTPTFRPEKGTYNRVHFDRTDAWAQESLPKGTDECEVNHLADIDRSNVGKLDSLYIMQWQATPAASDIRMMATLKSNPSLYYYGYPAFTKSNFPTVILHDNVGIQRLDQITEPYYDATMMAFAKRLSLYLVSQNCKVSNTKHRLLKPPKK